MPIDIGEFSVSQDEARFCKRHIPVGKSQKGIDKHRTYSVMGDEAEDDDFRLPSPNILLVPQETLIHAIARDSKVQDLKLGAQLLL